MQWRISIPPVTRILLVLLFILSITYQVLRYWVEPVTGLALQPQLALFTPWVYFTATYSEQNVVTICIAGATILYGGKYLERAWGSVEFGKFILLVTLIPNFVASLIYVFLFAISRNYSLTYVLLSSPATSPISVGISLICRQSRCYPRLRGIARCFPRGFQTARTRTHSHHSQRCNQDPSKALPIDLSCGEHPVRHNLGNRHGACSGLAWVHDQLDVSKILQDPARHFNSQHGEHSATRRCIRDIRIRLLLA